MGNKASKTQDNDDLNVNKPEDINTIKLPTLLHIIAAKYIIQSTFQDLENLHDPEYCNKLVVLTSDVIEKHLNNLEVTFLDKTINADNQLTTKPLVYITQSDLDLVDNYTVDGKKHKCMGIAKFYIKIAHLFAAINKTVNPLFTYIDPVTGKNKTVELLDKDLIPKGPKASLSKLNYCSRRIAALKIEKDNIIVPNKHCDLNKKVGEIFKGGDAMAVQPNIEKVPSFLDNILNPGKGNDENREEEKKEKIIKTDIYDKDELGMEDVPQKKVKTKNLTEEIGIPELEKLYYDDYDYETGEFTKMTEKSKTQYEADLELFYKTFSGKNIPLDPNTNEKKIKKFSDIQMHDYHNKELCKNENSEWNKSFKIDNTQLFTDYANHIQNMIKRNEENEIKLMSVLHQLFNIRNHEETKELLVSININLNHKNLDDLIDFARKTILQLYIDCEVDFQKGLDLLEAIILYRMENTSKQRIENFKEKHDKLLGMDKKTQEQIKKEREEERARREEEKKRKAEMKKPENFPVNQKEKVDTTQSLDTRSGAEVAQDAFNDLFGNLTKEEANKKMRSSIDETMENVNKITVRQPNQ